MKRFVFMFILTITLMVWVFFNGYPSDTVAFALLALYLLMLGSMFMEDRNGRKHG